MTPARRARSASGQGRRQPGSGVAEQLRAGLSHVLGAPTRPSPRSASALSGPTTRDHRPRSSPGEPGSLQVELPEGDYRASAVEGGGRPSRTAFTVGRERPSSRRASCCCPSSSPRISVRDQRLDALQLRPHRLDHRVEAGSRALSELVLMPVSAERIAWACFRVEIASAAASRTAAASTWRSPSRAIFSRAAARR